MRCIPCEERRQCGCGDTVTPEGVGVLIRNLARTGQFTGRKPVLTNKLKPVRAAAAGVCAVDMKKIIVLGMFLLMKPDSLCLATRQRPWRMGVALARLVAPSSICWDPRPPSLVSVLLVCATHVGASQVAMASADGRPRSIWRTRYVSYLCG